MTPRLSVRLLATQSDGRLVELVAQGNELAFEAIVLRYRRALLRYCGRMGLSESRGEDVLQHALLRAWLALKRGDDVRELRAWLYRIVRNTAVDALRRGAEQHAPLPDDAQLELSVGAGAAPDAGLAVRATLGELAGLPRLQREAILMSAVEGRSYREVAGTLGISEGAVRGLLYRARTALRGAVAALTPQPFLSYSCSGRGGPSTACLAELCACGAGGMTATLTRGAAVALTAAAAVVAGVAVVPHHARPRGPVAALAVVARPGDADAAALPRGATSPVTEKLTARALGSSSRPSATGSGTGTGSDSGAAPRAEAPMSSRGLRAPARSSEPTAANGQPATQRSHAGAAPAAEAAPAASAARVSSTESTPPTAHAEQAGTPPTVSEAPAPTGGEAPAEDREASERAGGEDPGSESGDDGSQKGSSPGGESDDSHPSGDDGGGGGSPAAEGTAAESHDH